MPVDLSSLLKNYSFRFDDALIKAYMLMILRGVLYLHDLGVMHRDIKPSNVLVSSSGVLKIGDFGLARRIDTAHSVEEREYTHQIMTRWYRAPEILYGARNYDEKVDIWSVGCIFAEMWNRCPLFPGVHDIDQLNCVFGILGTPDETNWPVSLLFWIYFLF